MVADRLYKVDCARKVSSISALPYTSKPAWQQQELWFAAIEGGNLLLTQYNPRADKWQRWSFPLPSAVPSDPLAVSVNGLVNVDSYWFIGIGTGGFGEWASEHRGQLWLLDRSRKHLRLLKEGWNVQDLLIVGGQVWIGTAQGLYSVPLGQWVR